MDGLAVDASRGAQWSVFARLPTESKEGLVLSPAQLTCTREVITIMISLPLSKMIIIYPVQTSFLNSKTSIFPVQY